MFKQMEITEQVYKGWTPSKTLIREDANRYSNFRKLNIEESASPTNSNKWRSEKRKKQNSGHLRNGPINPRHSSE